MIQHFSRYDTDLCAEKARGMQRFLSIHHQHHRPRGSSVATRCPHVIFRAIDLLDVDSRSLVQLQMQKGFWQFWHTHLHLTPVARRNRTQVLASRRAFRRVGHSVALGIVFPSWKDCNTVLHPLLENCASAALFHGGHLHKNKSISGHDVNCPPEPEALRRGDDVVAARPASHGYREELHHQLPSPRRSWRTGIGGLLPDSDR